MNTQLLKDTFRRACRENGGLTSLGLRFYERLFNKYPQVRALFRTPPEQQHRKLTASIGAIVAAVDNPDLLVPYLHAMGIRHLKYQTENAHYPAVAENLIAVLREHLTVEGDWTDEMETVWKDALEFVSEVMIEAANEPARFAGELSAAGYQPDGFCRHNSEPWILTPVSESLNGSAGVA